MTYIVGVSEDGREPLAHAVMIYRHGDDVEDDADCDEDLEHEVGHDPVEDVL